MSKKHDNSSDEDLFNILASKAGEYGLSDYAAAEEILLKRGYGARHSRITLEDSSNVSNYESTNFTKNIQEILIQKRYVKGRDILLLERFGCFSDEKLIDIIENKEGAYNEKIIEITTAILRKRGYNIGLKNKDKTMNSGLLIIISVILLLINYYLSRELYSYGTTGIISGFARNYLESTGIFHDLIFRAIVITIIVQYLKPRKSIGLWIIGSLLFGAWALLALGLSEGLNEYEGVEE